MGHCCGRGGAVPMLFARWNPDDVTGANFLDRASPALGAATTSGHNESLAEWMGVPRRSSAGLECDAGADHARGRGCTEQWIDTHRASEPIRRAFAGRLCASSLD